MKKVFKGCKCPYGGAHDVDSTACRMCCYYSRNVGTFIWCSHPVDERAKEKAENHITVTQKTATRKPVSTKKKAKGNSTQIKTGTKAKKRGRPRKAK